MEVTTNRAVAQGAVQYLDSLVEKGRARPGVVAPLKTALTKVLQKTEGDNWTQTDLAAFNVDDAMSRFKNLTMMQYSEGSYRTYELRVRKAIKWYLTFLRNPGWVPPESPRSVTIRSKQMGQPAESTEVTAIAEPAEAAPTQVETVSPPPKGDTVTYPFPLSGGKLASLRIPLDITRTDVERLHTFLQALIVSEQKE